MSLTIMESKAVTLRWLSKRKSELFHQRLVSYHLLHPDLKESFLHPSRRMHFPSLFMNVWMGCESGIFGMFFKL